MNLEAVYDLRVDFDRLITASTTDNNNNKENNQKDNNKKNNSKDFLPVRSNLLQ